MSLKNSLFLWVSQFLILFSSISVERGCKKHAVLITFPYGAEILAFNTKDLKFYESLYRTHRYLEVPNF